MSIKHRLGKYLIETKNRMNTNIWKPRLKHCGNGVIFDGWIEISEPEKVSIGNGTLIHSAFIQGAGGVSIGEHCHFGRNLSILSANHNFEGGTSLPFDDKIIEKPVRIDNYVWVGMNVSIVGGVHIGEGAVIGMGSVITKDVPPRAIVGGNPAKLIRMRDDKAYERQKGNMPMSVDAVIEPDAERPVETPNEEIGCFVGGVD